MNVTDWNQVRIEYERGDCVKDICVRHDVSLSGIRNQRYAHGWSKVRHDHERSKFRQERASRIRELYECTTLTKREIAAREGVSLSLISTLCRTQSWKPRQKGWKGYRSKD